MSEHQKEYPLLVVHSVEEGTHFVLLLNDRFPNIHFMTKKYGSQLGVTPVLDVPDEEYGDIYEYVQKIYGDYDES